MMRPHMRSAGALFCVVSATGFGAMAVFGKLAYDAGATVGTLLAARFILAAALFWGLVLATGAAGEVRCMTRRDTALAIGLGGVGYAAQAGCFFAALERIDASLLALLLYTFPSMVSVAAIVLGRERADRTKLLALALASAGVVLVLASASVGALDPLGVALALSAASIYTVYILTSQGVAGRVRPGPLSALVCTGAAVSLTVGTALVGDLRPGEVTAEGWGWLGCIAVVSTFLAVSLFFAGLKRVGPTTAAILSTTEPVVTVVLAFLVFDEVLSALQLVGGAFVVGAVLVLSSYRPREAIAATPV